MAEQAESLLEEPVACVAEMGGQRSMSFCGWVWWPRGAVLTEPLEVGVQLNHDGELIHDRGIYLRSRCTHLMTLEIPVVNRIFQNFERPASAYRHFYYIFWWAILDSNQ